NHVSPSSTLPVRGLHRPTKNQPSTLPQPRPDVKNHEKSALSQPNPKINPVFAQLKTATYVS
ncbi:MAG TPA: hypothetical protein VJL29_15595, partial [Thermoguttaceae bacterium]|nr:hypothetical protein [Thermoguttaceae bacterium]